MRSGRWGRCFLSICSISALLSFKVLSQLRLPGSRGGARLRRLGDRSHMFTRAVLRPGPPPYELHTHGGFRADGNWGGGGGRMLKAERRDGSLGCACVCRRPPAGSGQLCPRASQRVPLSYRFQMRGRRGGGRGLADAGETGELQVTLVPFHRRGSFIRLANIGRIILPRFPHLKK